MKQHQHLSPHRLLLEAQREQLAQAALAAIPPNASAEMKARALQNLVTTLKALREWDRWDRFQMPEVVRKENYGIVDEISVGSPVNALHMLPDGRIVSGSEDNTLHIWSKGGDGKWSAEVLKGHTHWVYCLQALPDGRIVSGSFDNTLRIWSKGGDGKWIAEVLEGHTASIICLQALPDGRIVSGSVDNTLRIWSKGGDGKWSAEVLEGHTGWVLCLQALPDGRIVSGSWDGTIRIWDGEEVAGGAA